jgi:hypothetical protein
VSTAIAYARSKNVVVVAAAGNSRAQGSPIQYPAADAGVITVAATDSTDTVANYSNAGDYVDVAAPGSAIVSTYPRVLHTPGYGRLSGTSMAAPHVAAVAALLVADRPGITPDEVETALKTSAIDLGGPGRDNDYGYGRVDAAAALEAIGPVTTPPTSTPVTTEPTSAAPTTEPPATEPTTEPPATEPTTEPPATEPATPAPTATETSAPTSPPTTAPAPNEPAPTKPAPAQTVVTADSSTQRVTYGTTAVTTFTVTAGGTAFADQPASICVAPAGETWSCTPVRTTADGTYLDTRTATGAFRVRLVVAATGANTGASATATRTVKAAVAVTRTAKGTLAVAVNGPTGQAMTLQRYTAGQWTTVQTYATEVNQTLTGLVSGATYRVVVAGTATVQSVTSGSVKA